jgi:hypothetical protein
MFSSLAVVPALVLLSAAAGPGSAAPQAPAPGRIVVVGDIHGAAGGLRQILRAAGLLDAGDRWTGGTAHLVQTGDYLDRGRDVRAVLDLLMRLEGEAARAGGRVDVLLGNHEAMNILHDLRDVSPEAYAAFADAKSEERRRRAYDAHATIASRAGTALDREQWMAAHPRGYVEYVDALGPRGQYGRWIRGRPLVLVSGGTIFMHAGLRPDAAATIAEVNRNVEREVREWDRIVETLERARLITRWFTLREILDASVAELRRISAALKDKAEPGEHVTRELVERLQQVLEIERWALVDGDGPLWYRGLATLGAESEPEVEAMLARHGATRLVGGHTPQLPGRITTRFGGRVVLIDTGMLNGYFKDGRPSALEIADGRLTAVYLTGREPLPGTPETAGDKKDARAPRRRAVPPRPRAAPGRLAD